jgi:hypothetical protein
MKYKKSDFYDMPETERINALNTNAEKVLQNYAYSKQLTEGEIKEKNREINQALQEINRLKEERKLLTKEIATHTEIILNNNKEVITGETMVNETIWLVNDNTTGYLEKINAEGLIIERTRMAEGATMNMFRVASQKEAM